MASNVKYETWPDYETAMKNFFNDPDIIKDDAEEIKR